MVTEVAIIDVTPGTEADFEAGYRSVRHLFDTWSGSPDRVRMTRGVETPSRFILMINWDDVAAHQAFRDSTDFATWRGAVSACFAGPPHVEHFADV